MPLLRDHAASRYKVLVATCLLTFGSYFCFDMPSMLEKPLTDSVISHASFAKSNPSFFYQLFYTVYAWTNMAMSLLAGWMVDRVGLKTCVFLFLSFCLVGSALFGLAFTLTSLTPDSRYILMFVGRFIFGLGGGSITIGRFFLQKQSNCIFFIHVHWLFLFSSTMQHCFFFSYDPLSPFFFFSSTKFHYSILV